MIFPIGIQCITKSHHFSGLVPVITIIENHENDFNFIWNEKNKIIKS